MHACVFLGQTPICTQNATQTSHVQLVQTEKIERFPTRDENVGETSRNLSHTTSKVDDLIGKPKCFEFVSGKCVSQRTHLCCGPLAGTGS